MVGLDIGIHVNAVTGGQGKEGGPYALEIGTGPLYNEAAGVQSKESGAVII